MANYNGLAGLPLTAGNELMASLYRLFRTTYFKGQFKIADPVIATVDYDVTAAPTLARAQVDTAALEQQLVAAFAQAAPADAVDAACEGAPSTPAEREALAGHLARYATESSVRLAALAPVTLGVRFEGGERVSVDALVRATLEPESFKDERGRPRLRARLVDLQARLTKPDESLQRFLDRYALPLVRSFLEPWVQRHSVLPELNLPGLALSAPALVPVGDVIVGVAALLSSGPTVPPDKVTVRDPRRSVLRFDGPVVMAVAKPFIDAAQARDRVSEVFWVGPVRVEFYAQYAAGLSNLSVGFTTGNVMRGSLSAFGEARAGIKIGDVDVPIGVRARATPRVLASLQNVSGWVRLLLAVAAIEVEIEILHLPSWLNWLLSRLISFFSTLFGQVFAALINVLSIPIIPLPQLRFTAAGITVDIRLDQIAIDTIADESGRALADISGVLVAVQA